VKNLNKVGIGILYNKGSSLDVILPFLKHDLHISLFGARIRLPWYTVASIFKQAQGEKVPSRFTGRAQELEV
jgi:hypothetical protein